MDQPERSLYEAQSKTLRAELKTWETSFANANGGKKPSRADIKQAPGIAQKYKDYNKIRDILSGKTVPPPPPPQPPAPENESPTPRKRKAADDNNVPPLGHTPSGKRTRSIATITPLKRTTTAHNASNLTTPSTVRKLFGTPGSTNPAFPAPTSIGPTPQRDGRVLGIFDLMVTSPVASRTPSHRPRARPTPNTTTPKRGTAARLARTPVSSSKRHMLDNFMTPLGKRDANSVPAAAAARTPTSSSSATKAAADFATPQFLRRLPPAPVASRVDENGDAMDPEDDEFEELTRPRLPRKPLVRGLSSVVASLRKMEEEKLDDELEALHEMEAEMMGGAPAPAKPKPKPTTAPADQIPDDSAGKVPEEVLVADSQAPPTTLLGGFDDEGMYDSPEEDKGLDRNGQPLRVFKKKGQKRTTRRSNMRPVRSKRPAGPVEDDASETVEDDDVVPETQRADPLVPDVHDELSSPSGSEFEDDEKQEKNTSKGKKKQTNPGAKDKDETKKDGTVARAVKKVSAAAHQNFRRLKLRNNGAKGGPGFNSKFRRRR